MKKKIIISISIVVGFLLIAGLTLLFATIASDSVSLTASATQIEETKQATVNWKTNKNIRKVTINVYHKDNLEKSYTFADATTLLGKEAKITVPYGKTTLKVTVYKGICKKTKTVNLEVGASEYNIAPLMATMPVTMFTLDIDNITQNGTIPTFVWFDRGEHWNYANLPTNVHTFPGITQEQLDRSHRDYIYDKTSEFVKELYDITPTAKFNFYYNDGWSNGYVRAVFANKIPETNCKLYLLSDGAYSFASFNTNFDDSATAVSTYNSLKAKYELLKAQVASTEKYLDNNSNYALTYNELGAASYVLAREYDNVEWWLPRKSGVFAPNNTDMRTQIENDDKVVVKSLSTLYSNLSDDKKQAVKNLFNFGSSTFEEAIKQGKKSMIILGTNFEYEYDFDLYVKATKKLNGDDFVYYYKGHPRYPAVLFEGREDYLKNLGLYEIESTIPAELLFFFNEEAFATGYQSSTFLSLTDEQSIGVFNTTLKDFTESYENNLNYVLKVTESTDATYGSLITSNKCIVAEFTNNTTYDIAVYDGSNDTITYYKKTGSSYQEVAI